MPVARSLDLSRIAAAPLLVSLLLYAAPTAAARALSPIRSERALCRRDGRSVENSHEQHNNEVVLWRARWAGDDCSIDLRATGDVKFNSDFTDIVSVSNGGSLDVTDVDGNTTRRLRMRPDGRGMSRTYSVNGREQPWDDSARRWLAGLLIELDRISRRWRRLPISGALRRGRCARGHRRVREHERRLRARHLSAPTR